MWSKDIGIDLGTVSLLICDGGEIVVHEPSVVAIDVEEQKLVAVGQEAKDMDGRVPESIQVMHPLREGVIADYEVTQLLLQRFIEKVCGPFRLFKPRVMMSVPWGVTSVESRAVHEAALHAGSRQAYLIHGPLAAAIGAGLPIGTPSGNMIVSLGGGTTEAAVISMNGIVAAGAVRAGGMKLDEAIVAYVRKKYGVVIGEPTAEGLKIQIGAALPGEESRSLEVQGRDQVTGLPRTVTLTTDEVAEAMTEPLALIVETVRGVLERTPPELTSDIIDRGIALCGGAAQLRGIDRLLTKRTGVPTYVAEHPVACIASGAGRALERLDLYRRSLPPV